jgi:hypothetical protein
MMVRVGGDAMSGWAEQLDGAGKILRDGVEIGEVFYTIRVYLAGPRNDPYPFATFRQRGYLALYDLLDKTVTLILEDGRRWDCRLTSLDGTVGAVGAWPGKEGAR